MTKFFRKKNIIGQVHVYNIPIPLYRYIFQFKKLCNIHGQRRFFLFLFLGDDCETDTNACADSPCALGRNCNDLTPAEEVWLGRTYNCSSCPAGYNITADEKCEGKTFNYKNAIWPINIKEINFEFFAYKKLTSHEPM